MAKQHRITIRVSDTLLAALTACVRQDTTVSDVIREALEAYLGVAPARRQTPQGAASDATAPLVEELQALRGDVAGFRERLTQLEERLDAMSDTRSDSLPPPPPQRQTERPTAPPVPQGRGYDASRFVLGKLCPLGHEYESTGQTLWRVPGYHCRQCENALARERRRRTPGRERGL